MIILRRFGLLFCSLKWGHSSMNMPAGTLFNEQNKGPSLLSIITWSVLGKQNVQAEKVYCLNCSVKCENHFSISSMTANQIHISFMFIFSWGLEFGWQFVTLVVCIPRPSASDVEVGQKVRGRLIKIVVYLIKYLRNSEKIISHFRGQDLLKSLKWWGFLLTLI